MPLKVAFQGEPGAYSEQAVYELLGESGRYAAVGYPSFDEAFAATQSGKADFLLAPIENTLGGTIHANCDLQLRYNLSIVGEYNLRVRHNLMALPGSSITDIKKAISHPQALAQCDAYLRGKRITAEAQYDTAGSAKIISIEKLVGVAAVASKLAAKHYGLEILDSGIEDDSNNFTRFLLLRTRPVRLVPGIDAKTSIVFSMKENVAGALFKALSVFALRDIDLSKIESRPCKPNLLDELRNGEAAIGNRRTSASSPPQNALWMSPQKSSVQQNDTRFAKGMHDSFVEGTPGQTSAMPAPILRPSASKSHFKYLFYADLLAPVDDPNSANALRHLQEITSFFRVLGSYPRNGVLLGLGNDASAQKSLAPKLSPVQSDRALVASGQLQPEAAMYTLPPRSERRNRVGILGFGNFGQFLAKKLVNEYTVFAYSRSDYSSAANTIGSHCHWCDSLESLLVESNLDYLIVSVSILSFEAVMHRVSKCLAEASREKPGVADMLVVDVLSVKVHARTTMLGLLPDSCDVLCTHPMFGPESGKHGWSGLPFVYERVRLRDARRCEDFLHWWADQGCRMEDMTCELHDRCAAGSQFVTHFTGRVLSGLKPKLRTTPINTKGFDSLLQLVDNTCKDSFDLFFALYKYNPESETQLQALEQALAEVATTLRSRPILLGNPEKEKPIEEEGRQFASSQESLASSIATMSRLNPRVSSLAPSATVALYDKTLELQRAGRKIISLNVGQPDYLPHESVTLATERAARYRPALRYSPVAGSMGLRESISAWYKRKSSGLDYDPASEIMVSNGGKQCLYQCFQALCSPGDEVIIPSPYWVSYPSIAKLAGATPIFVQTRADDGWKPSPNDLRAAITPKTRILMLTNPSNPTGAVLVRKELEAIASMLQSDEAKHVTVVVDEIYSELLLEDGLDVVPFASISGMRHRTVTINGCSKNWAMTGYRVGWLCGPKKIVGACSKYQGQVTSCACSLSMHAAVAALESVPQTYIDKNNVTLRERRDVLHELITSVPGVKCPKTQGAFYLFADISELLNRRSAQTKDTIPQCSFTTSAEVCLWLLDEASVSLVPGEPFGMPGCMRIAYTASMDDIRKAGKSIAKSLSKLLS